MTAGGGARRLDRWLWCSRLFRTRSAAAEFVANNAVRHIRNAVTQRVARPGFCLETGDIIAFMRGDRLTRVRVIGFSERRPPAAGAAALLEWIDDREL
ncbi:MAG: RNA-binding S4 domain-containing protein [Parvularculaceae bacterium]